MRLWPVSRELYPKQFLRLIGEHTLFQATLLRAARVSRAPAIVVCNEEQRFIVAEQVRQLGLPARIVLEPARRDSGPAIAAAAELVARASEDGLMLVLPCDHHIRDEDAFAEDIAAGRPAAEAGHILTFGVPPDRPAEEYGYIAPGAPIAGGPARAVEAFVEKPDAVRAEECLARGHVWNSGMFLMRARVLLDELAVFEPAMAASACAAVDTIGHLYDFVRLGPAAFLAAPAKSIDYAVMERTARAAVLPARFSWSDVGNWSSLWDEERRDEAGNAVSGHVALLDTRNSYIRSDTLLTGVVGLDDVVVVATDDAVLVAAREHAQKVKALVDAMKARGRPEIARHRTLYRPWGTMQTLDSGERFEVKHLTVQPGAKISLHRHFHRAEHWVVVRGTVKARIGDETRLIQENESMFVPLGALHRLENPGRIPVEVIEVRTGAYLGEDDMVRVADMYGRSLEESAPVGS